MKMLLNPLAFALLFAGVAAPALAAAPTAGGINGVAFANLEGVVANSNAAKAAQTQRQVTYKAQIDQYNARGQQIEAQLKPMVDKFEKDRAAGAPQATLQQEYTAIQQIQDSAKQELGKIMEPVQLSEAYGLEQINAKIQTAVPAAMQKAGVTLLLRQDAVVYGSPATNISQAVLDELNTELPSIDITPPAGWEPAEVRAQKAAQAGARGTSADGGR